MHLSNQVQNSCVTVNNWKKVKIVVLVTLKGFLRMNVVFRMESI